MMQIMSVLNRVQDTALRDKELLAAYDAATPEQLMNGALLLPGELSQLFKAIQELSGFGEGTVSEAKN